MPVPLDGVAEVHSRPHFVGILPAPAEPLDISGLFQVGNDALDGPLGYSHAFCHGTHNRFGFMGNHQQDMRMIG